jgi:nicotinamide-nucleotide amidase
MGGNDRDAEHVIAVAGISIAVAESLTGGLLSGRFAAISGAGKFFRGGVVAYAAATKFSVLGVHPGPVICQTAAQEMAIGVCKLLDADLGIGITGVGGPGPEEDQPAGTVFVSLMWEERSVDRSFSFGGIDPEAVCHAACDAAVSMTAAFLRTIDAR